MKKSAVAKKAVKKEVSPRSFSLGLKNIDKRIDSLQNKFSNLEHRFDGLEKKFDNLEKKVGQNVLASEKRVKAYTQEAVDMAFRGFYAVHEKTQDHINLLIEKMDSINVLIYKTGKHDTILENHSRRLTAVETVLAER